MTEKKIYKKISYRDFINSSKNIYNALDFILVLGAERLPIKVKLEAFEHNHRDEIWYVILYNRRIVCKLRDNNEGLRLCWNNESKYHTIESISDIIFYVGEIKKIIKQLGEIKYD